MPSLESLRLRTGQLVTEDWYDELADLLSELAYGGALTIYGYVSADLIPAYDLMINLGISLKRFKELWAGHGYFAYDVYVQGKVVLKDGDCIELGAVTDGGKDDLAEAMNRANISYCCNYQSAKLALIADSIKPIRLAKEWETAVDAGEDIFTPDLVALWDGRLRVKLTIGYPSYAYLKHKLNGEAGFVEAMLNAGVAIPANSWHEFDFTIEEDDEANFSISSSTTVTFIVYNIPSA